MPESKAYETPRSSPRSRLIPDIPELEAPLISRSLTTINRGSPDRTGTPRRSKTSLVFLDFYGAPLTSKRPLKLSRTPLTFGNLPDTSWSFPTTNQLYDPKLSRAYLGFFDLP